MRRVREIITRPEIFHQVTGLDHPEDYIPDPTNFYFKADDGLVIYEPKGVCLEMHTAITTMPKEPIRKLHQQWKELAKLGYHTVYAFAGHERARAMCRAAGMECVDNELGLYQEVIYGS